MKQEVLFERNSQFIVEKIEIVTKLNSSIKAIITMREH